MTLKQANRYRFLRLCEQYRAAKQQLDTTEGRAAFIALSVQLHIAKGDVPKRMWRMVNA